MIFNIVLLLCFLTNISTTAIPGFPDYSSENDGIFIVLASGPHAIVLIWKLTDGDVFDDAYSVQLKSRCMYNMAKPTRLRKNYNKNENSLEKYYEVVPGYLLLEEVSCENEAVSEYARNYMWKPNELKIFVNQTVPLDVVSKIEIEKIPRHKNSLFAKKSAKVVTIRSAKSYPAIALPDTGSGCFQILNLSDTKREVHLYWRTSPSYRTIVYILEEIEDELHLVRRAEGPWKKDGSMRAVIGGGRYRFILEFFNGENRIGDPKIVKIPAQGENNYLIQNYTGSIEMHYDPTSNTHVLLPIEVDYATLVDYTIFLIDHVYPSHNGMVVKNIMDFVHIPPSVQRIEIKADRMLKLGISLNTEDTSSGLIMV